MVGLCYLLSGAYSFFTSILGTQSISLFLISLLIASFIMVNIHYAKQICELYFSSSQQESPKLDFDYDWAKGPHRWKELFPNANGSFQSPINIQTETTDILRITEPLLWFNYDELPEKVFIENNGLSVLVKAQYAGNLPKLAGADLVESYEFVSLCFRWSFLDNEGSEHSINDKKYPLELQAQHFSRKATEFNSNYGGDIGILMLSYFFAVTKFDNGHLDPIILNLHLIREPFTKVQIPPFPLSWLCYPFKSGFYSYGGSLTEPPCTEGVTWFIQPEPMAIGVKQLAEFRALLSKDSKTRILKNSRPIQYLNARIICYNKFDQFAQLSEGGTEDQDQPSTSFA